MRKLALVLALVLSACSTDRPTIEVNIGGTENQTAVDVSLSGSVPIN